MSFENEFTDLMPDTITVNSYTGADKYGNPTYSTSSNTYSARVVDKQKLVRADNGEEQVAKTTVYVASTGSIDPNDKITLPDNSTPPVLSVDAFPDEDGTHHIAIYFGGG